MVPRNPQEKSYCPKRFYGTADFSSIFQDIFKLFFQCTIHIRAHIFWCANKLLLPVVLTERLKKNIFDHKLLCTPKY